MTFLCGQAGVSALGAVVAKQSNDDSLCDEYLTIFRKVLPFKNKVFFRFMFFTLALLGSTFFFSFFLADKTS